MKEFDRPENKFVVRKGYFHTADRSRFVITGWFDGADPVERYGERADASGRDAQGKYASGQDSHGERAGASGQDAQVQGIFSADLDGVRLKMQTLVFADESVRQKYAKFDQNVQKEYVLILELPPQFDKCRRLRLCLSDGTCVYERRVSQLKKLRGQLECRVTDIQITGADLVLTGWAVSGKPVQIRTCDAKKNSIDCEVSHFPRPDVMLEYRENQNPMDCGFSIRVPMQGRKKMLLQMDDGEASMCRTFRAMDKNRIVLYAKKAHYYMKRNGMKKTCKRAVNEAYELIGDTGNYMKWRAKHMPCEKELAKQRQKAQQMADRGPLVYVVTAYENNAHLVQTAASLARQTYAHWKWIVAYSAAEKVDDLHETDKMGKRAGIRKAEIKRQLSGTLPASRVALLAVPADAQAMPTSNMPGQTQAAMRKDAEEGGKQCQIAYAMQKIRTQLARKGQPDAWITWLEPGDTLEPDTFYHCVSLAQSHPRAELCYTDEDRVSEDGGKYSEPVFKSDFNIDMLRAMDYFGNMVFVRGSLACRIGEWNPAYGLAAPYDYHLRAAESAAAVIHLPQAVYHVRAGEKELAKRSVEMDRNGQPRDMAVAALDAHYQRMGIPATVRPSEIPSIYRTTYRWKETPLVSINIPNMDHIDDLDTCVQSVLHKCTYSNYEIVIIENNSTQEQTFAYYDKIQKQDSRVRVVYWKEAFNFSKITNYGVAHSKGEYILLLNNDTEVIAPDFIEEMLGYCMREDVGVCGARLFYFDDTVQHAGVVVGLGGICGEGFQKFPKENPGYCNRICCPQDYSAVTAACMMTPKDVFEEVGGMDADFQVAYNDIDYCLKVRKSGRLVVYNPYATLYHYEYKSRGVENTAAKLARYNREVELFTTRWADIISAGDPYYNPNLTRRYQDFSLRRIELLP